MTRWFAHNRWLARRLRTGQGGFSLLMTIIIMAVTFIMISALLFLTFTTSRVSTSQLTKAREWRAADGAMDAAVNKIVQDATATLGSISQAECKPVQTMDIGGVQVDVKCTSETSEEPFVIVCDDGTGATTTTTAGAAGCTDPRTVKVVGTKYRGEPAAIPNAAKNWRSLQGTCLLGDDCLPWVEAFGGKTGYDNAGSLATSDEATLIATGGEPLQFVGDVMVRKGAAAARNERLDTGLKNKGPALAVRGEYAQGDRGLLATQVGPIADLPTSASGEQGCGLLSKNKTTWAVDNTNVTASGGLICKDDTTTATRPLVATSLSPSSPDVPRVSTTRPQAAPALPACTVAGPNPVVLQPGAYDRAKTATLNDWFSADEPQCRNKVILFRPGDYWFDVNDPSPALGSPLWRSELRILDPTLTIIFGEPVSNVSDAATAGTALCRTDRPGVGITLSARTSIRHEAGRVAICGGTDHPLAIQQAHAVNTGWESAAANVSGGSVYRCVNSTFIDFCGVSAFLVGVTNAAVGWVNGTFGFNIPGIPVSGVTSYSGPTTQTATCPTLNLAAQCYMDVIANFSGWDSRGDTIGAPIESAQLLLDTTSNDADGSGAVTRIDVVPTGASTPLCSVTYNGVDVTEDAADLQGTVGIYDLLATSGRAQATPGLPLCGARDASGKTLINDRLQLYGAKIGVKITTRKEGALSNFGLTIRGARLRTDAPVTTGGVNPVSGTRGGPGVGVAVIWAECYMGRTSILGVSFPNPFDRRCPSTNQGTFSISNLMQDDTAFTADPNATGRVNPKLTSLGVNLTADAISASDLYYSATDEAKNYVQVSLMSAGGQRICTTQFRSGASGRFLLPDDDRNPRTYMALLGPGFTGDNGCRNTLQNYRASDLVGKSLEVTIFTGQTDSQLFPPSVGENDSCKAAIAGSLIGWFAGLFDAKCSGWGLRVDAMNVRSSFGDCTSGATCETTVGTTWEGATSPISVTSDFRGSTTAGATFNVYGDVSIPRSDLDVFWAGNFVADPIVKGNLWVNGIGSMVRETGVNAPRVGVLCCAKAKAAERVVKLEAWVGNTLRGTARVIVSDTNTSIAANPNVDPNALLDETWKAGTGVRVDYWQLCNNKRPDNPYDQGSRICART